MNSVKAACCVLPLALLASAPALASYQTCMTYCMKQHADFDKCHKTCGETEPRPDGASASPGTAKDALKASPGPQKPPKCPTIDQKNNAISTWLKQHYNMAAVAVFAEENGNVFEVHFDVFRKSGPNLYCHVNVTVDKHCGVEVLEFVEGDGC